MTRDDRRNDSAVGDATVVSLNDKRRVRGSAEPRLHTKSGASIAWNVSARAGAKAQQALEEFARTSAAIEIDRFVKAARKSQGYSQEELAKLVGVTQARISQWENMEKSGETIDIVNLFKIALVCNFPLRLDWSEKRSKEAGSRRKAQTVHQKQEGRPRHDHSHHDQGEM